MKTTIFLFALGFIALALPVVAPAQTASGYAGEETREVKSLSAQDIDDLRNGRGWGLAKSAELNGYPGPRHVLDMKKEIGLTREQEAQIEGIFASMKAEAIPLGVRLIELEKQLDELYTEGTVDDENLRVKLGEIGEALSRLRFVHLSAHLKMPKILTVQQVKKYNELRGYGKGDPCKNIPAGHDPEMWKQHNGCN